MFVSYKLPEECCEQVWEEPEALPKNADPNYPQENAAYFKTKTEPNYVRNNKISLDKLHLYCAELGEGSFPSLRSVYQNSVEVEIEGW